MIRRALVLPVAALAALAAVAGAGFSGASFSATSQSTATMSTAADWVAPAVTLATPADGGFTNDPTPPLAGQAGTAPGDAALVTAELVAGAAATGAALQSLPATVAAGAWSATATALADGQYTARARQDDGAGNTGFSDAHTFTVDTVAPAAADVQAADGGATAGHLESGDTLTLTFTEAIDPATVLPGWTGAPTAVRVQFANGGGRDTVTILDAAGGATVKLGTVGTAANLVTATVTFTATLTRSADGASVTATLGTPDVPAAIRAPVVAARTLTWTPVAGPADRAGNALALGAVDESGASDRDF